MAEKAKDSASTTIATGAVSYLSPLMPWIVTVPGASAAVTRVLIESTDGISTWTTIGVHENIIEASWQALRDSLELPLLRARST